MHSRSIFIVLLAMLGGASTSSTGPAIRYLANFPCSLDVLMFTCFGLGRTDRRRSFSASRRASISAVGGRRPSFSALAPPAAPNTAAATGAPNPTRRHQHTKSAIRRRASARRCTMPYRTLNITWGNRDEAACKWQCSCNSTKKGCNSQDKCAEYQWTQETRKCELYASISPMLQTNLTHANLGGHGPMSGARELRFSNVMSSVDLVVMAQDLVTANPSRNGQQPGRFDRTPPRMLHRMLHSMLHRMLHSMLHRMLCAARSGASISPAGARPTSRSSSSLTARREPCRVACSS